MGKYIKSLPSITCLKYGRENEDISAKLAAYFIVCSVQGLHKVGNAGETVGFRIRTESVFDFELLYPDPSVKIVL
jgi:hypothetical protein